MTSLNVNGWNYANGSTLVTDGGYVTNSTVFAPVRLGIESGEFIKPDPLGTLTETRNHILTELKQWLCSPRMIAAVDALVAEDVRLDTLIDDISAGMFPAGRMYMILRNLDPSTAGIWVPKDVGNLCYSICAMHLESGTAISNNDIQKLALGFVDVDRLPDGKVIRSFWDQSPFEPLRNAPPLSDPEEVEPLDEETDDEVEEATNVVTKSDYSMVHLSVALLAILVAELGILFMHFHG